MKNGLRQKKMARTSFLGVLKDECQQIVKTGKTQRKSPRVGSHCTLGAYGTLDPSLEVDGLSHPGALWLRFAKTLDKPMGRKGCTFFSEGGGLESGTC